jgi:hypothetical protein
MGLLGRAPFWFNAPQLAAENRKCEGFVLPYTQRLQRELLNTPDFCPGDFLFLIDITNVLSDGLRNDFLRFFFERIKNPVISLYSSFSYSILSFQGGYYGVH